MISYTVSVQHLFCFTLVVAMKLCSLAFQIWFLIVTDMWKPLITIYPLRTYIQAGLILRDSTLMQFGIDNPWMQLSSVGG